jgi:alpha-glucosidase
MTTLPAIGRPHHDGSALYVPDQEPALDRTVDLFVRAPHDAHVSRVALRSTRDGEPRFVEAVVDRRTERETWWRVALTLAHRVVSYRFLLDGGRHGYRWLNGAGVVGHDPTDAHDFRLTTHRPPPAWAADATVYQVLPDRFADSGQVRDWPDWAVRAGWDDAVAPRGPAARQLYGGDLPASRHDWTTSRRSVPTLST